MKRKTFLGSLLTGMFGVVVKKGEGSLSDPGKSKAAEIPEDAASGSATAYVSRITHHRKGIST